MYYNILGIGNHNNFFKNNESFFVFFFSIFPKFFCNNFLITFGNIKVYKRYMIPINVYSQSDIFFNDKFALLNDDIFI